MILNLILIGSTPLDLDSRDDTGNIPISTYITNSSSDFLPNMPNSITNVASQSQLPDIKIIKTIEPSSPISNKLSNIKPVRIPPHQVFPEQMNNLNRTDTIDSKSSNSSSVTTDFLSEEQREIVRKWLGPGQLLMLSYTQRVDKVGNLPDDSLVIAELYLSLKKIADEDILIVTANSLKNLKSKNITEVYIKLYLMYSEQQLSRVMKRKTKPIVLNEDNSFNETFTFNTQLEGMLLQVSLWSCGKGLNVHKMLGEAVIHLDDIEFVKKNSKKDVSGWYKLLKPDI